MICRNCSGENVDEAVFCQHCGKRLDGKIACPKCGVFNNEEANYCIQCGTKLNNKSLCPACGTVYEGNFCPACGKGATKAQTSETDSSVRVSWRKILEYVAGGLCMAGVLFALIFTFVIGVSNAMSDAPTMIYEFFGSAYTDVADTIDSTYLDASSQFTLYYPVVTGTLIVVATIATVLTFATLAVIRYVKFVMGKSEKDYAKFSAATVLSYLTGTVAFYALNSSVSGSSGNGIGMTVSTLFSDATTAGIVLASVFFALFAGCRIAIRAKDILAQKRLVTLILSAVATVCLSITLHFAGVGIAKASYVQSSVTTKMGGGYPVIAALALMNVRFSSISSIYYMPDEFVTPSVLAFVGMLVQIALFVMLACAVVKLLTCITSDEEKGVLKYTISAASLAVAHLALAITSCVLLIDAMPEMISVSYAYPIVALVFAAGALGVMIAQTVILKQQKKAEAPVEE